MSVSDKTIDPRILESARKEFLNSGFEKASLKNICAEAGVTTGALYKRYSGKDALFCALVEQTVKDLYQVVNEKSQKELSEMSDQELIDAWYMDEDYMLWWFDYIYQRREGFVLLLKCSAGSSYWDFANTWVECMNKSTYEYYAEAYHRGIAKKFVNRQEMHILISAFWSNIYEPFIHDMTWDEIVYHSKIVCNFFNWHKALEFQV